MPAFRKIMKKLRLKLDGVQELLTKHQMKNVNGGYLVGCQVGCLDGSSHYTGSCEEDVAEVACGEDTEPVGCQCTYD